MVRANGLCVCAFIIVCVSVCVCVCVCVFVRERERERDRSALKYGQSRKVDKVNEMNCFLCGPICGSLFDHFPWSIVQSILHMHCYI